MYKKFIALRITPAQHEKLLERSDGNISAFIRGVLDEVLEEKEKPAVGSSGRDMVGNVVTFRDMKQGVTAHD